MSLKNEEQRPLVAQLLETPPEGLVGWLVIAIVVGPHPQDPEKVDSRTIMTSNASNKAQAQVLINRGQGLLNFTPEEMTNQS